MAQLETAPDAKPMLTVADAADLERWLEAEHTRTSGVWLVRARRGSDDAALAYGDMLDVLLCFGWIDSTIKVLDDRRCVQWVSPRRKGSVWSGPNKLRVEKLVAAGRLRSAGQAAVDRAREDGSWTVLDGPENLEVPDDLAAAFDSDPVARANFDAFPPSARKGYLGSIAMAKSAGTRARRIALTVQRSRDNLRPGA